ncbi:MAG: diguanylate cyclase (GGDEF)-like protein/PAS domain S-box-containing protein [Candidatus Azotimanducaceae bacterium]|jgi:diguanylate cyclase (GGDEF)-like protein/PAS domain S-box-containing protein
MNKSDPIRLLILEESQNRAEELNVLLRTAGYATRAHQIESESDLIDKLDEQAWDLLLGSEKAHDLTIERTIAVVRESEKDVPIILIASGSSVASITAGLKLGAQDVALEDDDERLKLIIERELGNLENRRSRRRAEKEVREVDRRNQLLLASSTSAIAYVHEGMHIYTNTAYAELFGYDDVDDFIGIPIIDLIAESDQVKFKRFLKSYNENEVLSDEFTCEASDGSKILSGLSLSQATYDGESCIQVIFKQAGEDPALAARILEISSQDLLTGFYNRSHFSEQLDNAVDDASDGHESWSVFYISLDNFAQLRTGAGISNADIVLSDFASLIAQEVSEEHLLARFGDDVFTLLFKGGDKEAAAILAEQIRTKVESHLSEVDGKSYQMTVSIGLARISENTPSSEEIISRAHQATTSIDGGNGVNFYQIKQVTVGADGKAITSETIKDMVRKAISNNSFKLMFQPIISLHGDDDEQFEVLLRLLDEEGNELYPGQFLGPAEDAGLLEKLDRWVILQSIKLLSVHRANGSKARLFINLTHKSMSDQTFLPWMSVALKAARLPSDALIFQIHENDATSYIKQATSFAKGMAKLHCKTSINHFGCSLNPFNLLKHLTPDFVKLDASFAQEVETSAEKKQALKDMVESLQATGVLTAIAGVESPIVLSTLWQAGINFIQGFYISPPLENMDYDFASEDI